MQKCMLKNKIKAKNIFYWFKTLQAILKNKKLNLPFYIFMQSWNKSIIIVIRK